MGSLNIGSQSISFTYQEQATSPLFNQVNRDLVKAGVYAGGLVSTLSSHVISIAPFVSYIRSNDVSGTQGVRCQTQSAVSIIIPNGPSQSYTIYLNYTFVPSATNYADFNVRLQGATPATNEVRICNVTNNGAGVITTVDYTTRMRGVVDVDNSDRIATELNPTQGYHVGNQTWNDLRYVKKTGSNQFDIEVLDSTDGNQNSKLVTTITSPRIWTLQDKDYTIADVRQSFRLGMITSSVEVITPSDTAPWWDINQSANITAVNWPVLAPFLRTLSGTVNGSTTFNITSISTSGSPVTLTLANNATNNAFLLALNEEQLYHGSFVAFRTITTNATIGTFPVGTYGIQGISTGARTITITASYSGASSTGTCSYYPFRIDDATSTVNARWFQVNDSVLRTIGGDGIPYFRQRDRLQGFNARIPTWLVGGGGGFGEFVFDSNSGFGQHDTDVDVGIVSDGTNGTPRKGLTTRDKSLVLYKYLYGGSYTP